MRILPASLVWPGFLAFAVQFAARGEAPKPPNPASWQVLIETAVDVAGGPFSGKLGGRAPGRCAHDEKKSPMFEWVVQAESGEGAGHYIVLLYAPPSPGETDELTLMVTTPGGMATISSMKGAVPAGKGHLKITRSGKRAHFLVTGVAEDKSHVTVNIDCESTTTD